MTDTVDLDQLQAHLAALPELAERAASGESDQTPAAIPHRPNPGSRTPGGLDLTHYDRTRGRQLPGLLARLSNLVRTVCEEHNVWDLPSLGPEGTETWASEVAWLLHTMPLWSVHDYCREWIASEVDGGPDSIHAKLVRMIDAQVDRTRCGFCGVRLDAYTSDALMVATCPACRRVAGMEPRVGWRRWKELQVERRLANYRRLIGAITRL